MRPQIQFRSLAASSVVVVGLVAACPAAVGASPVAAANVEPSTSPITTLLGDVNGDGKADVIDVFADSAYVRLSTGSSFGAPELWSTQPFYGTKATLAADVTGDGTADLVAIDNADSWLMTSTGTSFNPPQLLLDVPFYGTRGTISGTGSSGVTRIEAINDASTWRIGIVVHSQAPVLDSSVPFFGNRATLLGDVTGDGYMDLIAVNTDSTWVMASPEGSQFPFEPPQLTSTVSFYGTSATLAGDVDGDGKAESDRGERLEHLGHDRRRIRIRPSFANLQWSVLR